MHMVIFEHGLAMRVTLGKGILSACHAFTYISRVCTSAHACVGTCARAHMTGHGCGALWLLRHPTLRPGTWLYHAAKHCECCAATPAAAPLGPRNTTDTGMSPADMYSVFAAELMSWSTACMAKFQVMNSQIGLRPAMAAPTARPEKPACMEHG